MSVDLEELKELLEKATPRPWHYNGYSAVFSGPMIQVHDDFWTAERFEDGHTYDHRVGKTCEACGDRPVTDKDGNRTGTYWDCARSIEADDVDCIVASVPASYGDTATRVRVTNAQLIEAGINALPELIDEVERLHSVLYTLGFCPTDGESMPCMTCGAGL